MVSKVHFSSETDDWATPQDLFDRLNKQYGPFDLDVCASKDNAKCIVWFDKEHDGLSRSWTSGFLKQYRCWMNPPYGRHNGGIGAWVKKAYEEGMAGGLVCCLLPARTDTKWFHEYCVKGEIEFLRGRVKFGGAKHGAPFPSMVVVFRPPIEEANNRLG